MPEIVNVTDFLKVGIMAFVFIFIANRILARTGFEAYKA